jgi:hypothetical protein
MEDGGFEIAGQLDVQLDAVALLDCRPKGTEAVFDANCVMRSAMGEGPCDKRL